MKPIVGHVVEQQMEMSGIHRISVPGSDCGRNSRGARSEDWLADPVKASAILVPNDGNVY